MPSLSEILSGFKRTTSSTAPARAGLSWATEAVKPVNKTNAQASESFAQASGILPRNTGQQKTKPKNKNENYITRTKGEFEHDLDQYGYDPLYGQRDYQSDVDIWTHIKEVIHPKHKEQQEYIDIKDEALFSGIKGIYETRRSKSDIEKIIQDYYGDDISRIEGKVDSQAGHSHGFDPIGDLTKSLTSILIIAGLAYVGFKFVLPMVRKRI